MVKYFQNQKRNADEDNNQSNSSRNVVVVKMPCESVEKIWISKFTGCDSCPSFGRMCPYLTLYTNRNSRWSSLYNTKIQTHQLTVKCQKKIYIHVCVCLHACARSCYEFCSAQECEVKTNVPFLIWAPCSTPREKATSKFLCSLPEILSAY